MMATAPIPPTLLFSIETNTNFCWLDENRPSADLISAITCFDFGKPQRIECMTKRNQSSTIYRITTEKGIFVLRSTSRCYAEILEEQCLVASRTCTDSIIHPLKTAQGTYTAETSNNVWIAYPYQRGEIFTGSEPILSVFNACQKLNARLESSPESKLFSVLHTPQQWGRTFRFLEASEMNNAVPEFISAGTSVLLAQRRKSLESWIINAERPKTRVLTHNDLNHANILIHGDTVTAIDLEDICYENRDISAAHCLFKLIRHALYTKKIDLTNARDLLQQAVISLKTQGYDIQNVGTFFKYASFRILSEIHMILTRIFIIKSANKPKDLEKKIHNLFELEQICSI